MKNKLLLLMLVFVAMIASFAFISCGGDDDNDGPKDESATYSAKIDYDVTLTADMIKLFDVVINYYDPIACNEVSEKVSITDWTKSFTVTRLPAKAYLFMNLTLKSGATVSETFKYSRSYDVVVTRYKNDKEDGVKSSSSYSTGTMAADKFPVFLEKYCAETPCIKSSTIIVSTDDFNEE